jgi:hypothetical protein
MVMCNYQNTIARKSNRTRWHHLPICWRYRRHDLASEKVRIELAGGTSWKERSDANSPLAGTTSLANSKPLDRKQMDEALGSQATSDHTWSLDFPQWSGTWICRGRYLTSGLGEIWGNCEASVGSGNAMTEGGGYYLLDIDWYTLWEKHGGINLYWLWELYR